MQDGGGLSAQRRELIHNIQRVTSYSFICRIYYLVFKYLHSVSEDTETHLAGFKPRTARTITCNVPRIVRTL